jgi:hypothetical protein
MAIDTTMRVDKFTARETMNFGRKIWIKRRGRNRKENRKMRHKVQLEECLYDTACSFQLAAFTNWTTKKFCYQ